LYLRFASMIDLGTSAAGEDIKGDRLQSNIERHVP